MNCGGYVYAFLIKDKAVKFGKANNVRARYSSIRSMNIDKIIIAGHVFVPDDGGAECLEEIVHLGMERFRIRGEWYYLRPITLKMIELMRAGDLGDFYRFARAQMDMSLSMKNWTPRFSGNRQIDPAVIGNLDSLFKVSVASKPGSTFPDAQGQAPQTAVA